MKLYNTIKGILLEADNAVYVVNESWDLLVNRDDLAGYLSQKIPAFKHLTSEERSAWLVDGNILPPIGKQEVWAAGVTYLKSRDARMEESQSSGAASLYDKVYDAERPELFFKATSERVAGHAQQVYIRKDSAWNVPEPELTLFINSKGKIQGYTIGNDMSSRDIEGENPLYLPQAKSYDHAAGLGPCILLSNEMLPPDDEIRLVISRGGKEMFNGATTLAQLKRKPEELVEFLTREMSFPDGGFLMTGTGIVPPDSFTLHAGDEIRITIEPIGTLVNTVA